jgi:predicted flavoprotein YhiN
MPRLGKKILITGGGRCNLGNERLDPSLFTSTNPALAASVFARIGTAEIVAFLKDWACGSFPTGGASTPRPTSRLRFEGSGA